MIQSTSSSRVRAFGFSIISAIYFYFARMVAASAAHGLTSGAWLEIVTGLILLFLLLLGYGAMGRAFDGQQHPLRAMGLDFRPSWRKELGLGAALGWGMLLVSILPLVLSGGLIVTVWTVPRQFLVLGGDFILLAVASLVEEIVFRGYPFQRLIEAVGPGFAVLLGSVCFGLLHLGNPGANRASTIITMFCGWFLSLAYLRTRALWVCWGWHFAWNASMCLLFGLPLSGITRFSPVIQSNTIGPIWITGGDYGPEASLVTAVVLLAGLVVLHRTTRDYAYKYAQPAILPGGIPVDLDAMRGTLAPHHAEMEAGPAGLVQINPAPRITEPPGPSESPDPPPAREDPS